MTSPSACLLRFVKLPEDHSQLVSLKDAAVIVMAYMEQMTHNYVSSHGLYKVHITHPTIATSCVMSPALSNARHIIRASTVFV